MTTPAQTVHELSEDYLTGWVPDVAANFDALSFAAGSALGDGPAVQWLDVPKPDGVMHVPVLHPGWQVALHQAVAGLRDVIDATLAPGVYGYRRGADPTKRYAFEWQRFSAHVRERAASSEYVVIADVKSFLYQTAWPSVIDVLDRLAPEDMVTPLAEMATRWEGDGLTYPPPGYADARMLANALLATVDSRLPCDFARWVDDYRLFVDGDPEVALAALSDALLDLGLELNPEKTRVLTSAEALLEHENKISAFYHEDDAPEVIQQSLRDAFTVAHEDPAANRRVLRFVLARLEHFNDGVAVDFALDALTTAAWEAPRLVSYLSLFKDDPRVTRGVAAALAARPADAWLVARAGALALHTGLDPATLDELARALPELAGTPGFAVALRLLARAGRADAVEAAGLANDPRAALVALGDLGRTDAELAALEPTTATVLRAGAAPLPELKSRL
jgi:hypothetical protein